MQPNQLPKAGLWLALVCVACWAWSPTPASAQQQVFEQQPQQVPTQPYPQQQPSPQQLAEPGQGTQEVIVVPSGAVPAPSGYTLQQTPDRYQQLQARLAFLRAERSRYSVGGAIVMISLGAAMVVLGGSVAWTLRALDRGGVGETDVFDRDRASIIFLTIMGGGALMTTFGAIKLARRSRMRRQYDPEIRQIREELRQIEMQQPQYTYGAVLDFGLTTAGLGARLRF